jgi:hypothetical protein
MARARFLQTALAVLAIISVSEDAIRYSASADPLPAASQRKAKKKIRPPIGCGGVVCSGITAERVTLAPGESTRLRANASDPDGDVLNFAWQATAGSIVGSGSDVEYHAPSDKTGRFLVTVVVDDGHGHTFECSIEIEVAAHASEEKPLSRAASN